VLQSVNDFRNEKGNAELFSTSLFDNSTNPGKYLGMFVWNWNDRPVTNGDNAPLDTRYCTLISNMTFWDSTLDRDPGK